MKNSWDVLLQGVRYIESEELSVKLIEDILEQ